VDDIFSLAGCGDPGSGVKAVVFPLTVVSMDRQSTSEIVLAVIFSVALTVSGKACVGNIFDAF